MTNITHFKLYHYPATRSARVRWALLETVGEGFELEKVELFEGAQYAPDFLERNPNHNVPMLEMRFADGSQHTMLESGAIIEFLAENFPAANLAPPPEAGAARMDYLQMLHFAGTWMDMMLWQLRLHKSLLPREDRDEKVIAYFRNKFLTEVEPQLTARLSVTPYICGADFCAADIIMGHNVLWAGAYDLAQGDVLQRYIDRLAARPAFKAAFADSPFSRD